MTQRASASSQQRVNAQRTQNRAIASGRPADIEPMAAVGRPETPAELVGAGERDQGEHEQERQGYFGWDLDVAHTETLP